MLHYKTWKSGETRMTDKKKNIKRSNIIQLILGIVILFLINIIAGFIFTRFDLTAEKRYSLAPATKAMLRGLKDEVLFKVYLEGDLPPGFRRLANETKEMLDEFRAYSDNVQYEFVDPSSNPNPQERNDGYKLLSERGLQPTVLSVNKKGQASQLIIFPGAMVSFRSHEVPVQLVMSQLGQNADKALNSSVQSLEYNLASAIEKLTETTRPQVAFIDGEGELSQLETQDAMDALSEFYTVERVTINKKINSLATRLIGKSSDMLVNKYRAIIIAKPTRPFDEKDKFLIDQFIMRGGKVLWLIDPVFASMDSLQKYSTTMGLVNDVNLEDMLFNYGVRLNTNLVMDKVALPIPVKTGQIGDQPQFDFFPWYFFPVLTPMIPHPIVNGLNAIKTEFISSIDTVAAEGVKKTVLLTTSPYSRTVNAPVFIDLDILRRPAEPSQYNKGPQPVALLLEGSFTSSFLFRIPPELSGNKDLQFLQKSRKPTKMIVVADGDIIKNQFHFSKGYPMPLGYDQYTRQTFGNRDFLLNAMNYLCDDSGLISVRSREVTLRMLDATKIERQRLFWQILNVVFPLVLILLFSFIKFRIRARKYSRPVISSTTNQETSA
ncbi:MAG: gliding motility-associated ABC transporter substrate-binding protein GldG [Bacteroidetes bacterium]|nr:gliding motility-associated ABC transporter substrate-binding protein GldG [Bacteroidota bacterium]